MARPREENRFDPIDTEPDVAVGIGLPFAGRTNVFHLNYTTEDQAISNLKNLVLTRKGERIMQPQFGWGGWGLLFEPNTPDFQEELKTSLERDVSIWLPYINIEEIILTSTDHSIRMSVKVSIQPTGANRTITLDLTSTGGVTITEE